MTILVQNTNSVVEREVILKAVCVERIRITMREAWMCMSPTAQLPES